MSTIKLNQIAIDGPSASGKSSIGLAIANKLHWNFLSSGKIYRSVAGIFYQSKQTHPSINLKDFAQHLAIEINHNEIFINGQQTKLMFDPKINQVLAEVALDGNIRQHINDAIINYAKNKNVIIEGRDIATEVLPDAFLKIYIDADVHIRAKRRFLQLKKTNPLITIDEITAQLKKRDYADQTRTIAPLKIASDAVVIDTTKLTFSATVSKILKIFGEKYHV